MKINYLFPNSKNSSTKITINTESMLIKKKKYYPYLDTCRKHLEIVGAPPPPLSARQKTLTVLFTSRLHAHRHHNVSLPRSPSLNGLAKKKQRARATTTCKSAFLPRTRARVTSRESHCDCNCASRKARN